MAAVAAARLVSVGRRREPGTLRVPRLVDRAARSLRPAPGTGVRFALSAPARSSAPVRPALAGALVGVVGLVAVAVVGASLHRLVDVPARWGTTWDVAIHAGVVSGPIRPPKQNRTVRHCSPIPTSRPQPSCSRRADHHQRRRGDLDDHGPGERRHSRRRSSRAARRARTMRSRWAATRCARWASSWAQR